jgi:hypothetical protein
MAASSSYKLDSLKLGGCVIIAYVLLFWAYDAFILDSNLNLTLRLPTITLQDHWLDLLLGLFYALMPAVWIRSSARISVVLYVYLYLSVLVPSVLFVTTNEQMEGITRHIKALFCVFCFGVIYLGCITRTGRFKRIHQQEKIGWWFVGALAVLGSLYLLVTNLGAFQNVQFIEVYERRLELRDRISAGTFSRINVYLTNWMGIAIAPFLVAYGIYSKKRWYVAAAFAVAFVAFAVSTHKTVFFSTAIVLLFALSLRFATRLGLNDRSYHVNIAIVAVFGFLMISILIDLVLQRGSVMTFLVPFRMFLNNGYLTSVYLEFFQDQDMLFYSDSFMSRFISSAFDQSYSIRVGDYIGRYDTRNNANANFLADGYANIGYVGMVFASLQLAFVLWLMDTLAKGRLKAMAVCVILPAGLIFANGPVHTALSSSGVFVSILLLLLVPNLLHTTRIKRNNSRCPR